MINSCIYPYVDRFAIKKALIREDNVSYYNVMFKVAITIF